MSAAGSTWLDMKYLNSFYFPLRLASYVMLFATTNTVAQEDFSEQLGEDVYWVPQVEVKFKTSKFEIIQGEKVGKDGCRFPYHLTVDPSKNPLQEGERLVKVRRAVNPSECIELVEIGVVEGDIAN